MKNLPLFFGVLRVVIITLIAIPLFSSAALGLDLKPDEIRGKSSKKAVSVLQNRYFLKSYRPEAGMMVGSLLDEAYTDTKLYGARAGMFFTEWLGFEVQMAQTTIKDTADREALNGLQYQPLPDDPRYQGDALPDGEVVVVSPDPEVNAVHGMTDFHAVAAPFYGKLNLMNKMIVYTDLYFCAGVSRVETDQGELNALNIGAGERFYVGKAWSFRIDFKDRIYNETRAGQKSRKNGLSVDFGASYFFN